MNLEIIRVTFAGTAKNWWFVLGVLVLVGLAVYAIVNENNADVHMLGIGSIATLIAGAQLLGPEWQSGLMLLRLTRPVGRTEYVVSRVAGVLAAVCLLYVIPTCAQVAAALVKHHSASALSIGVVNRITEAALALALLVFFGSFTQSYQNVLLYIVLFSLVRLTELVDAPAAYWRTTGTVLKDLLFPILPLDAFALRPFLTVWITTIVLVWFSAIIARRRDVSYGSD